MCMHQVSSHSAVLEVWASAGTYIKEFIHGDLGRTLPNVGSLLGKQVDILAPSDHTIQTYGKNKKTLNSFGGTSGGAVITGLGGTAAYPDITFDGTR